MESMFDKYKVNNTLNVYKDAKSKARKVRTLAFLIRTKINLCRNQHGGCHKCKFKIGQNY
jgi:hypothetical protein